MRLKTCRKLSYQKICRKLLASAGQKIIKIITKSSSRKPLQLHSSSHLACHALNQSHNCPRVPLQSQSPVQSPVQSHISLRKYVRPLGQQQRRECVHSRRVIPADPVCGPLWQAPLAICNCLRSLVCHLCRSTSCHELAENSTIFLTDFPENCDSHWNKRHTQHSATLCCTLSRIIIVDCFNALQKLRGISWVLGWVVCSFIGLRAATYRAIKIISSAL